MKLSSYWFKLNIIGIRIWLANVMFFNRRSSHRDHGPRTGYGCSRAAKSLLGVQCWTPCWISVLWTRRWCSGSRAGRRSTMACGMGDQRTDPCVGILFSSPELKDQSNPNMSLHTAPCFELWGSLLIISRAAVGLPPPRTCTDPPNCNLHSLVSSISLVSRLDFTSSLFLGSFCPFGSLQVVFSSSPSSRLVL